MRYLLRNSIRDAALESLRRSNPGKVLLRPMVGGRPLPPGGVRYLNLADFTEDLLSEIEYLSSIGNVQLLVAGRLGTAADITQLRTLRGFKEKVVELPAEPPTFPAVEDSTPVEEVAPPAPTESSPTPTEEPEASPTEPTETLGEVMDRIDAARSEDIEEEAAAETPAVPPAVEEEHEKKHEKHEERHEEKKPKHSAEDLLKLKLPELRELLVSLGGKASGKNKDDLVSEILERQEG